MAWYSIMPAHLTIIEVWVIRLFLFLAIITIAPWAIAVYLDFVIYIGRLTWYFLPIYGGRAKGATRPRAPSLIDRPRRMSLAGIMGGSPARSRAPEDQGDVRKRHAHQRYPSEQSITEEKEDEI